MPKTHRSDRHAADVGRSLKAARHEVGITQADLADRLGIAPPAVAAMESGRKNMTIGQLATLAKALDVELDIGFRVLPSTPRGQQPTIEEQLAELNAPAAPGSA